MATQAEPTSRAPAEQRAWESRAGRTAAALAFLSAALSVAATAYTIGAVPRGTDKAREALVQVAGEKTDILIAVLLSSASILLLAPVLLYLWRVTRYRRDVWMAAAVVAVLAPLLFVAGQLILNFQAFDAADKFVASGPRTEARADDLLEDGAVLGASLRDGGKLALGFALVVVSLNAMRAGVLSRFMGVLGVILGALYVLPLGPTPLIQFFWVSALGALFLDRWPGGRGPAWEAMTELPWPTAAQIAEHRRDREGGAPPPGELDAEPQAQPTAKPAQQRSRKRKKRR